MKKLSLKLGRIKPESTVRLEFGEEKEQRHAAEEKLSCGPTAHAMHAGQNGFYDHSALHSSHTFTTSLLLESLRDGLRLRPKRPRLLWLLQGREPPLVGLL